MSSDWDKGYRKALEDVFDALDGYSLTGVWWIIEGDIPHESVDGVADREKPTNFK